MRTAGVKHSEADALSRLATIGKDTSLLEDEIPVLAFETYTREDTSTNHNNVASPQSFQPPTLIEFLPTQASNIYCRTGRAQDGHNKSDFNVINDGLLFQHSHVDGAI